MCKRSCTFPNQLGNHIQTRTPARNLLCRGCPQRWPRAATSGTATSPEMVHRAGYNVFRYISRFTRVAVQRNNKKGSIWNFTFEGLPEPRSMTKTRSNIHSIAEPLQNCAANCFAGATARLPAQRTPTRCWPSWGLRAPLEN